MLPNARRRIALVFVLLAGVSLGIGHATGRPWTPDDALLADDVREVAINRDGTLAAWIVRGFVTVDGASKPTSHLWWCRLPDGEPRQLTRGHERVSSPTFAPDGRHLAFLSDRTPPVGGPTKPKPEGNQLWALPTDGGEAFPVSRFDRGVVSFDWTTPQALIAVVPESPSHGETTRKDTKDTAQVVDDAENTPPVRLFHITLDGTVERRTTNDGWISGLAVAPNGRHAVVLEDRSLSFNFDQRTPPHTHRVDLTTGVMTRVFDAPVEGARVQPGAVVWSADSSAFYVTNEHTRHATYRMATITELYRHDVASGTTTKVALDWPRGIARGVATAGTDVVALLADGVRFRPARLGRGGTRRDLEGTHATTLDDWRLAMDGTTLLYKTSSATRPPQWYAAQLDGNRIVNERQLTKLNPGFADKATGRVEVVRWTGALGEEVEGLLHYPLDWPSNKAAEGSTRATTERRPLILDIHGGPAGTDRDTWDFRYASPNLLWRQRGAFVLQVNYHGSAGYGLDWVESIENRYYELELPDIEAGVDEMIARGLADPDRLGTTGWSNGGILSAGLIVETERYKAASVGAADIEWISDWANVDFGAAFDNYYFGGPPWERLEHYIEKSPFFRLDKVTTPTIVHTGTEDRNVPPHQSWSLFRALQQHGKAETKLVLYPGEPHGLRTVAHQRRKLEEDLAWFDRHLFGTAPDTNRSLKQGSPLDQAVQRARAARHGALFGTSYKGHVMPETVATPVLDGVRVGRFEITAAQWASYNAGRISSSVASDQANVPASGLTFEQAQTFVEWLVEATGQPFRLPTEDEARKLAAAAGSGGNTLDHWAGYAPNPEDAARLRQAAADLAGDAPLLKPVGAFAGLGDDPLYDLDGNVAEWAVTPRGDGVAIGPSADRAAGTRDTHTEVDPTYVGFRVVMDDPAS